jgi:ATP-dependent Clp protease adaptor protein ClpS
MSDTRNDTDVIERTDDEVKEPSMYKVILINDDYTPMDVVTAILSTIFHKTIEEAINIMLKVHKEGRGLAGVYTHDIASSKQDQATSFAKKLGFPLKIVIEEE